MVLLIIPEDQNHTSVSVAEQRTSTVSTLFFPGADADITTMQGEWDQCQFEWFNFSIDAEASL